MGSDSSRRLAIWSTVSTLTRSRQLNCKRNAVQPLTYLYYRKRVVVLYRKNGHWESRAILEESTGL